MALSLFDRVRETTTTAGTGTITLAGAVTGYQSFSVVGNGNVTYYCIAGQGTSEWEVGIGTYTSAGTTLSRDTVLSSSNSGSLVVFSAGTKDVFVTYPSERAIVGSVTSIASASTITPDSTYAQYEVTALAVPATIAAPSGTPIDGQKLLLRIIDNGTARALTWTTTAGAYRARNVVLPTTTVVSSQMYVGCIYNAADNYWDVLSVSNGSSATVGTVTSVDVTGGTTGLTTSGGPVTTGGTITIAGTLAAANGGTGQTSYAVGDLLYASTTTALSKLADVATGNAVISGGVGVAPSYGKIGLTTHVSGTLPVANGGTGITTTPANGAIPIGNGTGYTATTLTAGSNVTITNGAGSITIAASGGGGSSTLTLSNKTAAYTVVAGDLGTIINCTANTFTVSLTAAATLGSGFNCWVWNTGTGVITIDPNAAETIDGVTTLVLRQGEGTQIVCNGTNWETGDKKTMRVYAENATSTSTRPTASGSGGIALGSSATASGVQGLALGYNTTASSTAATALGQNSGQNGSQAVTGSGAMALGGSYASGTDSIAGASANNTSTYGAKGANSVAFGFSSSASTAQSTAIGYNATATGSQALALGSAATASGSGAIALGSNTSTAWGTQATAQGSFAVGDGARASIIYKRAFAGWNATTAAAAQNSFIVLTADTTNATATVLTSNTSAASTTNQVILPNNSAYAFDATIVARQQAAGGTASAAWTITGLIRREGTVASTTLVASTTTVISNVPGWTIAVSADTTNGGLAVTATGAAATNIRWNATVYCSEITYA